MAVVNIRIEDSDEPTDMDSRVVVTVVDEPEMPIVNGEIDEDALTGAQRLGLDTILHMTQAVPAAGGVVHIEAIEDGE